MFVISDNFKPTVAHRDINSRNILVQPDLSLIIADLGFCMTAMGSKLIHKGHAENAEQTSLTDVSICVILIIFFINPFSRRQNSRLVQIETTNRRHVKAHLK